MYHTIFIDERVALVPTELNILNSTTAMRDMLETKLREIHEGKCNANGFVRPGSIQLLSRSMGVAENGRFTGNILYDCRASCEILYPTAGTHMNVMVIKVNKMGVYAVFEEAIRILLPRDLHVGSEAFDAIKEGDTVRVCLDRSRFQTKDPFVMAVGHLVEETEEEVPVNKREVVVPDVAAEKEDTESAGEE